MRVVSLKAETKSKIDPAQIIPSCGKAGGEKLENAGVMDRLQSD
jgi:hypothetical protein